MTRRILIVDDDEDIRRLVRRALAGDDIEFEEAADGVAGLASISERKPDLVVLDWRMPGPSGAEVLTELKRDHPELPVVLLTAELGSAHGRLSLILGADAFVEKPFRPPELAAVVDRLLS